MDFRICTFYVITFCLVHLSQLSLVSSQHLQDLPSRDYWLLEVQPYSLVFEWTRYPYDAGFKVWLWSDGNTTMFQSLLTGFSFARFEQLRAGTLYNVWVEALLWDNSTSDVTTFQFLTGIIALVLFNKILTFL